MFDIKMIEDDISTLDDLLDRADVLINDIVDDFIFPVFHADEKQKPHEVMLLAAANSRAARVKADILTDILSEARTIARALDHFTEMSAKEEHEPGK